MDDRVEREAPEQLGGRVALHVGDRGVGELVDRERDEQEDRDGDELGDKLGGVDHAGLGWWLGSRVSYRPRRQRRSSSVRFDASNVAVEISPEAWRAASRSSAATISAGFRGAAGVDATGGPDDPGGGGGDGGAGVGGAGRQRDDPGRVDRTKRRCRRTRDVDLELVLGLDQRRLNDLASRSICSRSIPIPER